MGPGALKIGRRRGRIESRGEEEDVERKMSRGEEIGHPCQNHHNTRISMAITGDNQTEHGTIGDLFRNGIHQKGKKSFQFKNQSFFITLTSLGMSIIITGTDLGGKRMWLHPGLPRINQDLLFHHPWILVRAGNAWNIKNFHNA